MSALPPTDTLVSVAGLTHRYGTTLAVDDLSFSVQRGEMFGLIGPDGAGKTTTLRAVLGLLTPSAGRLATCGCEPRRQAAELSRRVGYLSQRFSLYGDLSVAENLDFFTEIHGAPRHAGRRHALLERLRLAPFAGRRAEQLSGGMKQKLALACTLVHTPELLVLDEPTTGVDPVSRRDFWRLLAGLQRDGLTLLLTTPYLDEAERCQRVALIDRGRLLTVSAPDALRAEARAALVELIARPKHLALAWLGARPEVQQVQVFGERLHALLGVDLAQATGVSERLAAGLREAGVDVSALRVTAPTLEDIFMARVEGQPPGGGEARP